MKLSRHYWLYAPGEQANRWSEFRDAGIIALSYNEGAPKDLRTYKTESDLIKSFQLAAGDDSSHKNAVRALLDFRDVMKPGDLVFAKKGQKTIVGVGRIAGEYEFAADAPNMQHRRQVEWFDSTERTIKNKAPIKTLTDITPYADLLVSLSDVCDLEDLYTESQFRMWDDVLEKWPIDSLRSMTLAQYNALGSKDSFCYLIEGKLQDMGSVWGGSAYKFGIFEYNTNDPKPLPADKGNAQDNKYRWYAKYGDTADVAFETVRSRIVQIAEYASQANYGAIDSVDFSPAIKWKIAFLYQNRRSMGVIDIFKQEMMRQAVGCDDQSAAMSQLYAIAYATMPNPNDVFVWARRAWRSIGNSGKEDSKMDTSEIREDGQPGNASDRSVLFSDLALKFKVWLEQRGVDGLFVASGHYVANLEAIGEPIQPHAAKGAAWNGFYELLTGDKPSVGIFGVKSLHEFSQNYGKAVSFFTVEKKAKEQVRPLYPKCTNFDELYDFAYESTNGDGGHTKHAFVKYCQFLCELESQVDSDSTKQGWCNHEIKLRDQIKDVKFKNFVEAFTQSTKDANLKYDDNLIKRFVCALMAKPFVVLTGLSGSGKTKLADAFTQWIGTDDMVKVVPVGADWTNNEKMLGYPNALDGTKYVLSDTGILKFLLDARDNEKVPFFLVLDEMNLSHVERYFADFLSAMESGKKIHLYDGDARTSNDGTPIPAELEIPKNLFVIGTMNVDETTYMFSPKVLDRAQVVEFRVSPDEMKAFLAAPTYPKMGALKGKGLVYAQAFLELSQKRGEKEIDDKDANAELQKILNDVFPELAKLGSEFAYRCAIEVVTFVAYYLDASGYDDLKDDAKTKCRVSAIDAAMLQKLLPKLHGSLNRLGPAIDVMLEKFSKKEDDGSGSDKVTPIYPLSHDKLLRMKDRLEANGFTSYAEA